MKTYTFHVSLPGHGRVWRKLELPGEASLEDLHFAIQNAYDFDADHLYSFFMSGKAWDSASEYSLPDEADPLGGLLAFEDDEETDEEADDGEIVLDDQAEEADLAPAETPSSQDLRTMFTTLKENPELREQFIQAFTAQMGMPAQMVEMMLGNIDSLMETVSNEQLDEMLNMMDEEDLDDEEMAGDVRTTTLESLALKKGKTFMYLFDYGDEWRFKVKVDGINNNADPNAEYPRLVEEVGEAPEQYPEWDEEGFMDDGDEEDELEDEQEDGKGI